MRSNAMTQQLDLPRTFSHRFCEFIEINEEDTFIGAMRNSAAWERACQRPAERIFYFENHNAYLCQKHYDHMIRWLEETDGKE